MSQTLSVNCPAGAWTLLTAFSANVLVNGPPGGYELFLGQSAPIGTSQGVAVTSLDGTVSLSAMVEGDSLYARPFGSYKDAALSLKLFKS